MLYGDKNDDIFLTKVGSEFVLHVSTTRIPSDKRIEVKVSSAAPYQEVRSPDQKTFAAMWLNTEEKILVLVFQKPIGQAAGIVLSVSKDTCQYKVVSNARTIVDAYPPPQNMSSCLVKWLDN